MNHHKLILLRHAKSAWNTEAETDFDRPLAGRGRKTAPRMGRWLREQELIPDVLLSSPAVRARSTAQLVAEQLGFPEQEIIWRDRIYDATLGDLLEVIEEHAEGVGRMLLIGHNPGLDVLLEYLSSNPPGYRGGKLMTTASIAVLDYGEESIGTGSGSARLEHLVRPKDLE